MPSPSHHELLVLPTRDNNRQKTPKTLWAAAHMPDSQTWPHPCVHSCAMMLALLESFTRGQSRTQCKLHATPDVFCTRKDKPFLLGKLGTTDFPPLASQPRVVADRLNVLFSADTKRLKNFWNSLYIPTRDQASLISAQAHHAAWSTSMFPTRCSLTSRTRLKQHDRQKHERPYEKKTCSFVSDLNHNDRVCGKN